MQIENNFCHISYFPRIKIYIVRRSNSQGEKKNYMTIAYSLNNIVQLYIVFHVYNALNVLNDSSLFIHSFTFTKLSSVMIKTMIKTTQSLSDYEKRPAEIENNGNFYIYISRCTIVSSSH